MIIAQASQSNVTYVEEEDYGVIPATPDMALLPVQSTSLNLSVETFQDPTVRADRLELEEVHGNRSVAGDIVVTLRHNQYDDFLAAALGGEWVSDVLKQGTIARSFTIQRGQLDIDQYLTYTGCRFNSFTTTITPGAIASATFGVMGSNMLTASTPLDASPAPALNFPGMNTKGGTVRVNGTDVCVTSATITVDNGMGNNFCIGPDTVDAITWEKGAVSGSLTFYYEDLVAVSRFLDGAVVPVSITIGDGTRTMTFTMPRVKFNTADLPQPATGVLLITMGFQASVDVVSGTSLQITRSA